MKIRINYDLITKISEGNKGFSLKKTGMKVLGFTTAVIVFRSITSSDFKNASMQYLYLSAFYTAIFGTMDILCSKVSKDQAIEILKTLSQDLKNLNINTNEKLLLKAHKYKKNYSVDYNKDVVPRVKQNKYIMIPVIVNEEEKEVSLVQEHIIGTDEYVLSYGEPKKVLKLVHNQ